MDRATVKYIALSTAIAASFFISAPSYSQEDQRLKDIVKEVDEGIKLAQSSQARIDKTQSTTDGLVNEFKQLLKVNAGLRAYNVQQRTEISRQEKEIAELTETIAGIDEIKRQVGPFMEEMITNLENFVALDVPFQEESRKERIAGLKDALTNPNIAEPERFRVILDAYKAEVTYGRSINAYEGVGPDGAFVNYVRLGRIGFYYQKKDLSETAVWDNKSKEWVAVPADNVTAIRQLIRMANRQVQQDITVLPLPAPTEK